MKKVLVIMLVLAMASAASAVSMSLTSGGSASVAVATAGTVIQVDLTCDAAISGMATIDFAASGDASIAVGAWTAAFNTFAVNGTLSGNSVVDAEGSAPASTDAAAGTILYSFDLTVNGDGSVVGVLTDMDDVFELAGAGWWGDEVDMNALAVSVVPEPMTVALLGLGGLFLRRRK